MKKIILFTIISSILLFPACGTLNVADVTSLTTGMTQSQVNRVLGQPVRILSSKYFEDGIEESFEYHTYYYDAYAVTFWNGRLTSYEFIYEAVPPAGIVPPNRPIPNRPHYPNRPSQPNRPNRPSQPNRPSEPNRPTQPNRPSRPENSSRPTTRPENNNSENKGGRNNEGGRSNNYNENKKQTENTTREENTRSREEQKKE